MWKYVFPGIAMIGVVFAFARFSFGLFLPNISQSIDLTESNAGFVGSLAFASYSLALLSSAYLIQKYGQLRIIKFAGWSAVIGLAGIAFSQNFSSLALSSFVAGLGSGWASPAYAQIVGSTFKKKDKDSGNTWINSGTSFGLIISGPIALFFTDHWRLAFILFAAIAFVVTLWNSKIFSATNASDSNGSKINWRVTVNKAKFLLCASLITGISSSIFWTFSRSYLTAVHEMTNGESVMFWVLMGASGILGGIAGGFINKFGLSLAYRLTLVFMQIAIWIITLPGVLTIYSSGILFGISYIFMTGIFIVWATRIFSDSPSLGVSLSFLFLGIGQSIGSTIAGTTIAAFSYPFSFTLFSLIGLIGLLVPVERLVEDGS
ncbi:MFS transporter [Jeotgalibacillus proteolyticus]|uniref:MFS transporter n=1 Tax=Jeotgalibacillus proteolyticus TaxID=2082395 RepID=A0A2S5GBM6_9BACL|nr:MFS transporter [Jeotgalibacillus proteolyticus]PPA70432.1 MFS transporter [Jeotgalibacillus proteolyticus]